MLLNELPKIVARPAKRLGRGLSSGKGKTAGRGTKGQKSRSGYNIPRRFEGGQTSLIQKLPKVRGFKSRVEKPFIINIEVLEKKFQDGEAVNLKSLIEKKLIDKDEKKVKILGSKLTKKIKFSGVSMTRKLQEAYFKTSEAQKAVKEEKVEIPKEAPKTASKTAPKATPKKPAKPKTKTTNQ